MMKAKIVDISGVAKRSGIPASTIRFYEEKQLIKSVGRKGLKRLFDYTIFEQLDFIALGKRAGFSLEEISPMISASGAYQVDRALLIAKAAELDKKIKDLTLVKKGLEHAAKCSAPSHQECPSFQKLLKHARKTTNRPKSKA